MGAVTVETGRTMGRTLWLQALCGVLAGGLVFGGVGEGWRGLFALPVILGGGAALGPLLAVTPVEPSRLKLALFSSLLSPIVIAALFAALHVGAGLTPRTALAGALASGGALALLGLRSPVRTSAPGRQESTAVLLSLAAALALVLDGWGAAGSAARLADGGGVIAATVADGWLAGRGLESPWFAGGPLDLRPAVSLVVAVLAGGVGVQPSFVAPVIAGWAAMLVGCAAYLACAALARESSPGLAGARDLLAVVAALLVLPAARDPLLVELQGVGSIDPAEALAWALAAGVLLSGLHALRSGAAPWPALLGASTVGLTLVHPWAGAAAAAAMAAAASLHRRPRLAPPRRERQVPGLLQGARSAACGSSPSAGAASASRGRSESRATTPSPLRSSSSRRWRLRWWECCDPIEENSRPETAGPRGAGPSSCCSLRPGWGSSRGSLHEPGRSTPFIAPPCPSLALSVALAAALHNASAGRARALVLGAAAAAFLIAAPRGLQRPPVGDDVAIRDGLEGLVMSGPADAEILAVSRALGWIRAARGREVPAAAALVLRPRGATRPIGPPSRRSPPAFRSGRAGSAPRARQDRRFAAEAAGARRGRAIPGRSGRRPWRRCSRRIGPPSNRGSSAS